jgi:hypothetical protein
LLGFKTEKLIERLQLRKIDAGFAQFRDYLRDLGMVQSPIGLRAALLQKIGPLSEASGRRLTTNPDLSQWTVSFWFSMSYPISGNNIRRASMKYFVEAGKLKSAKGGLSKFNDQEALFLSRQMRNNGLRDVHIYNAKTWEVLTEDDLEATLKIKEGHTPVMPAPLQP